MTTGGPSSEVEVRSERMATGGEAVARLDDGRVIFVRGMLPGEAARVRVTEQKKRFARGEAIDIVEASPDRIEVTCQHAANGECGGCDWMHIAPGQQRTFKQSIVVEQLQRLGRVLDPVVTTPAVAAGRRTTVRCAVTNGRAGYRARRSDQAFVAEACQAVDPRLEALMLEGRFGDATEVTLRLGSATGDLMVVTNGNTASVSVPAGVVIASESEPGDAAITEMVAGRHWRISARSFFQTSHAGAEALVAAVGRALADTTGAIADLYGGVGLLGGGAAADRVRHLVESNPSSVADARHNLGAGVTVTQERVERWTPVDVPTVIADPARRGLGKPGVSVIGTTGATTLVLVSCDPASLGRDTGLLADDGWQHRSAEVIDMFPDTSRIEVVSRFTR